MELLAGVLNIVIFLMLAVLVGITCGILLFLYKIFDKLIKYDSTVGFSGTNEATADQFTPDNDGSSVPLDSFIPDPRKPLRVKVVADKKEETEDQINPLE